ncbi:polyribonucleotide nucleotidyltransferase [Patescibacteria group bacterium]|nr:polyribonucleotide nucleotidyltransferase [Patescibacteria group bacterium]
MDTKTFTVNIGGKDIIIETGRFAQAANASCTVRCGDTLILATAVMSKDIRPGLGFFPLLVDFEEKLYAAGRIKGSRFIKREGRPTDEAVLSARFIDRAIRPLFDRRMINDVQIIITVLSFDEENDPDILGLIGASCALHMSDIPWNGPIGAVRVSKLNGNYVFNGTYAEREKSMFDLDIAGTSEKVVMFEVRANEAQEEDIIDSFPEGYKVLGEMTKLIEKIRQEVGIEKQDPFTPRTDEERQRLERRAEIEEMAKDFIRPQIQQRLYETKTTTKKERNASMSQMKEELIEHLKGQGVEGDEIAHGTAIIYDFVQAEVSRMILDEDKRVDSRGPEDIRPLNIEVGLIPRVHGSGHFKRGGTQILSVCTLGAPGDKQMLDGMEIVGEKRFMHHYNFPPYSVGEAKPLRGAGRREIGHGALTEKSLNAVMPSKEAFPYTIRVVSEVLNSNGSSSMASTCGSTLALMDAGVPIKAPVAGIAIGLASDGQRWKVITDIQDLEDGIGGMDFKITGTEKGITAIQMDTKTDGLTHEIIATAFAQGKKALLQILKDMAAVIAKPREELSPFAPRILEITIDPDKIRDVIGPGETLIFVVDLRGIG